MRTIIDTMATYDSERGTTTQTRVIPLFEYFELNDDAQKRVIGEYIEERENDPYFSQWFNDGYESEIWDCVRDLEKSITGARVQWNYNRWYSCDFDCEYSYNDCYDPGYIEPVKDTGYYASMDICDAWNEHARKLNGLYYQCRWLEYLCWDVYNEWNKHYVYEDHNAHFFARADALRDLIISRWYEELEKACDDVRDTIEALLRSEWDYYTSEEYAREEFEANETGEEIRTCEYPYYKNGGYTGRVFYSDTRKWYLANGELYEQANINRKCVSIVKAS